MAHMGGINPLDPVWVDYQRRFGPLGLPVGMQGGPPPGHIPGVYPPGPVTVDLIQRERDRMERMGMLAT